METYQWVNLLIGITALFASGLSGLIWFNFKALSTEVKDIAAAQRQCLDSSNSRVAVLSERLTLMDYAKVSKEELYQAMELIANKIEKAIEEKQKLRDQRTEDNYLRLEAKLEELVKEFRNRL